MCSQLWFHIVCCWCKWLLFTNIDREWMGGGGASAVSGVARGGNLVWTCMLNSLLSSQVSFEHWLLIFFSSGAAPLPPAPPCQCVHSEWDSGVRLWCESWPLTARPGWTPTLWVSEQLFKCPPLCRTALFSAIVGPTSTGSGFFHSCCVAV